MTPGEAHRLGELMGADVVAGDGTAVGHVTDVRLTPTNVVRGVHAELVVTGLVVSGRHTGSLLGYDRRSEQGPWIVRAAVRRLHRSARYVPWEAVQTIDWDTRTVTVARTALLSLSR
jgi:sporulation protein YlmC with PRC-barrel domain